ncbi:hypothetical protein [Flavobacterium pedocola]
MKVSKTLKWTISGILGTFTLLFLVLVVHLATVKPAEYDNATLQISRIDFKEPIDPLKAKEIHRHLKTITGVKNDRINTQTGVLVYFHDNRIVNSESVFRQLMAKGNYRAERYIVFQETANRKVCPVMNTNSFRYKFSRGVQRIFK